MKSRDSNKSAELQDLLDKFGDDVEEVFDSQKSGKDTQQDVLAFGKQTDPIEHENWIWKKRGHILIIAIPFHKGTHCAVSPIDFLPLIQHVRLLHGLNCVHGDIRGWNLLFNADRGRLIDFDFGGAVAKGPMYPLGYVRNLPDGRRLGEGGQLITKMHDWYALGRVIFFSYDLLPPSQFVTPQSASLLNTYVHLSKVFPGPNNEEMELYVQQLEVFLREAHDNGWTVKPEKQFGLMLSITEDPSKKATGSPRKNLVE